MKYDVFFPTPIESITDPTNDNVDVCVTTADGEAYTLVFITPDNLKCNYSADMKIAVYMSVV